MDFDLQLIWKPVFLRCVGNVEGKSEFSLEEACELDEKQVLAFGADCNNVEHYVGIVELWHNVKDNLIDFINHFVLTSASVTEEVDVFGFLPSKYSRESCRLLMNTMFMFKAFEDHVNTLFVRKYGKSSDRCTAWKKALSEEYDNNFCYRFLYKLRNYTQHVGAPSLTWSLTRVGDGDEFQVISYFSRDSLLSEYKEWGAVVRKDLEAQPAKIDAKELLHSWGNSSYRLLKALVSLIGAEAFESASRLLSFRKDFCGEGVLKVCGFPVDKDQNDTKLEFVNVPEGDARAIVKGYPFDEAGRLTLDYRTRNLHELMKKAEDSLIL